MNIRKFTRAKTRDAAYPFRMPAGFPGDVNRTHPFSVEPTLIYAASPPTAYGQFVTVNATGNAVRPYGAADQSDSTAVIPYGVTVRPYPTQQASASNFGAAAFGAATPPVTGEIDVLRSGYIMAQLNDVTAAVVKGQRVYVWCAATSGVHVQGGIEAVFSAGNTLEMDARVLFNGPADSNGVTEISINP